MSIPGGITSLQSIPYQVGDLILKSGSEGMRIIVSQHTTTTLIFRSYAIVYLVCLGE
jgi:pantoate kinase